MKNIILTACITALTFSAALNYAFLTGKFTAVSIEEASYTQADQDFVGQLASK